MSWALEVRLMQELIIMASNQSHLVLDVVKCRREENHLAPVAISDILELEAYASSHSDYTRSMAMGCAKLSMGYPAR